MTTAWSHLPNAKYIDLILADLKINTGKWGAAYDAAWGAARDAARNAAWVAARVAAPDGMPRVLLATLSPCAGKSRVELPDFPAVSCGPQMA